MVDLMEKGLCLLTRSMKEKNFFLGIIAFEQKDPGTKLSLLLSDSYGIKESNSLQLRASGF